MRTIKIDGTMVKDPFFDIEVEGLRTHETGKFIDKKAIVHKESGQVISIVSPDWNIIQNKELVENFESNLRSDGIEFVRTSAGVNHNLTKFWANYRFPDVKMQLSKPYKTNFGSYQDDIELTIDLWGGYASGISTGFMIGGYRLICSNGLMRKENMFGQTWRHNQINQNDLLKTFHDQVQQSANLFKSQMIQSWDDLSQKSYDKSIAVPIMRDLFRELKDTVTYRDKLYWLFIQTQKDGNLKTMWQFYNMLTWFFTHTMEHRSRHRAMKLTAQVGDRLMGKLAA